MKQIYILLISLILIVNLFAQGITINGNIFDKSTLEPIEQANIIIKETEFGTTSYKDGYFSIINIELPITLIISHIGYEDREIQIANDEKLKVFLFPKVLSGMEVIIEGVQRHSSRDVSSKIEKIELESIEERGIRDISEILTEMEGVTVYTTSYGKQTISIRGSNPNEVAVYLDGIKLNNSATGTADLAYIDLSDLSEIEVVKGGSSTLFGGGNLGGVVLLHSTKPFKNMLQFERGFGVTDKNDQDLSAAGTLKYGSAGLYGRYSGKSRLFDGRTLFTSIFGNYGGILSFNNQELAYRHVDYDKFLEYPSGSIVSSDELKVDRITFFGNILNTTGWDIQGGKKVWTWTDDFYTNLHRELEDEVLQYRINKGFKFRRFSGSIQLETEQQDYKGDQTTYDSYSIKSWQSIGNLFQNDKGIASVLRYDVVQPVKNISLLRWEGGFRYSKTHYHQVQSVKENFDYNVMEIIDYDKKQDIALNTYRLGVLAEGEINNNIYKLYFSQGFNNRLPTLNDRFIWVDGKNQLIEYYNDLIRAYYRNGMPSEIGDKLSKVKNVMDKSEDELGKEYANTTEFNGQIGFVNLDKNINKLELGGTIFRNHYINKIAYLSLDNNIVMPYNTNIAWLNGAEINAEIVLFNELLKLDGNMTWVQPSDQEIFPNKPSTTGSFIMDFHKNWFHLNISHIFNGPQYYLRGGTTIEQLSKQKNTNLTISASSSIWYFDATLSYTIRNIFSNEVTVLSAGSQSGDVFNYYDAHRELINLKITLSDRKNNKRILF